MKRIISFPVYLAIAAAACAAIFICGSMSRPQKLRSPTTADALMFNESGWSSGIAQKKMDIAVVLRGREMARVDTEGNLTIYCDKGSVVVHCDGTVEYKGECRPDQAAEVFWKAVELMRRLRVREALKHTNL